MLRGGKNNGTILCFALRVHYESRRKAPNRRRSSRVLFRLGCHNTKVEAKGLGLTLHQIKCVKQQQSQILFLLSKSPKWMSCFYYTGCFDVNSSILICFCSKTENLRWLGIIVNKCESKCIFHTGCFCIYMYTCYYSATENH